VKNCDRPILQHQWDVFFVLLRAEGRAAHAPRLMANIVNIDEPPPQHTKLPS
jgi:hypothetical protein